MATTPDYFPDSIEVLPYPRFDVTEDTIRYSQALGYAWGQEDSDIDNGCFRPGISPGDYARFHLWTSSRSRDGVTILNTYRWFTTMGRTDR